MTVFVDTSALYALLDEDDANHEAAARIFGGLAGAKLLTHAYVLVETLALVSRRLGRAAVERLLDSILAVVDVEPVDLGLHGQALLAYRESPSDGVSFVDWTSFAFMRANRLGEAFAFDSDFEGAGFELAR